MGIPHTGCRRKWCVRRDQFSSRLPEKYITRDVHPREDLDSSQNDCLGIRDKRRYETV